MLQIRLSLMVMVAAVVVVKASTSWKACPTICFAIYRPQCGSDGKTYGNDCTLGIAMCKDRNLSLKHPGECRAPTRPCPQVCPLNFDPVCGSDGKTYGNDCQLGIASCNDPSITLKHRGECQAPTTPPRPCPQVCPLNFDPVCGSDGKTYGNDCQLGIASCNDPSITLKHRAPTTPRRPCPQVCPFNFDPECGSDGKTYGNDCQLGIACCNHPSITLKHRGECQAPTTPTRPCPQVCPLNFDPVCGSDSKTYGNDCQLGIASCNDPSITLKHRGECQASPQQCPVFCFKDYQPVCGSDGKTYGNQCYLRLEACHDPSITLRHEGRCAGPTPLPTNCGPGICPTVYQPVCGSDGKIYSNKCFFNFAKCKNPRLEQGSPCYNA